MASCHIHFSEKVIMALPVPSRAEKQQVYYDDGCSDGLQLIITYGGTKTYYFFMFFQGRPLRVKIGRVGDIKLNAARIRAHELRAQAMGGVDPSAQRRDMLNDMRLKEFYDMVYKPEYSNVNKRPGSIVNDDNLMRTHLKDLGARKLSTITNEEIRRLHNKVKLKLSPYTANRVLSLIKHMYNFAAKMGYIKFADNPALGVSKFAEKSRDRFLGSDEMVRFFKALDDEPNQVFKNYILMSLFTGQRRGNLLSMRWEYVDLKNEFIYFPDSKNGESLRVPITCFALDLLTKMKETADSDWVFPSNKGTCGHMVSPKRPWEMLLARANIDNLRLHDLRRTQGSYQAITGASTNVIGKSLGHKSTAATMVYARLSVDPVRDSMTRATQKMIDLSKGD